MGTQLLQRHTTHKSGGDVGSGWGGLCVHVDVAQHHPGGGCLHAQQTTNNKQQTTINKQQTTNNKQQTTNNKQQTTNNKQQTTNNKQQTTNEKARGTKRTQTKLNPKPEAGCYAGAKGCKVGHGVAPQKEACDV